jgi:HSP20 family protein
MAVPVRSQPGSHNAEPVRWDPIAELEHQLLRSWSDQMPFSGAALLPPLDIEETEDTYIVEVELPGVKKGDVDIALSGRRLTVSGERVEKERVGILRHRTRAVGKFQYEFLLPGDVDEKGVKASLDHGVLTITVPKAQDDRPHRIQVT